MCQLTGKSGKYVNSHIIPKALTRPKEVGAPFVQGGEGLRPVRRWSSWTDTGLVIRKGEDILEALDTWAIPVLRTHHLVWSGWGDADSFPANQTIIDSEKRGYRIIEGIDPRKLRLFLLSLLWRAAASKISEMSRVTLPEADLRYLSSLLISGDPGPIAFYPAQIIQLSTRGPVHNHTPIEQHKTIPSFVEGISETEIPIFRFYFDGLIIHFHRHANDDGYTKSLGNLVAGASSNLSVTMIPYNISFQREVLGRIVNEAETKFGDIMDRLAWPPEQRSHSYTFLVMLCHLGFLGVPAGSRVACSEQHGVNGKAWLCSGKSHRPRERVSGFKNRSRPGPMQRV